MLSFEKSREDRINRSFVSQQQFAVSDIPEKLLRTDIAKLPELSELQVVRHYTRLSWKNFSIDAHFTHWVHVR